MSVRVIVINGDSSWNFPELVWAYALDLFKFPEANQGWNRVDLINCRGVGDHGGHSPYPGSARLVPGNFPEDFFGDGSALSANLKDALRAVFQNEELHLSVSVILSAEDFAHISEARGGYQQVASKLSASGRIAINGLVALFEMLAGQTEDPNTVAAASTRLWTSVIVRDMGHTRADGRLAEMFLNNVTDGRVKAHNVFFLSNGKGLNGRDGDSAIHFAKLRLLIDVLQDNDAARRAIRPTSTYVTQRAAAAASRWLRFGNVGTVPWPTNSGILRNALLEIDSSQQPKSGHQGDQGQIDEFKRLMRQLFAANVPSEGTAKAEETALASIRHGAQTKPGRTEAREAIADAKTDEEDIAHELRRLQRQEARSMFYSQKSVQSLRNGSSKYKAALTDLNITFPKVVDDLIAQERGTAATKSDDLRKELTRHDLPSGDEGAMAKADEIKNIVHEIGKLEAATKIYRSAVAGAQKNLVDAEQRRSESLDVLEAAENNLIRPNALRTPAFATALLVLPILVLYSSRYLQGAVPISFDTLASRAFGPLAYIIFATLMFSALVGVFTAIRLRHKRNVALNAHYNRLLNHVETLRTVSISRLAIVRNRWNVAKLQLIGDWLGGNVDVQRTDAAETFINNLRRLNLSASEPAVLVEANEKIRLLEEAVDAYKLGNVDRADRIFAFLTRRGQLPSAELVLRMDHDVCVTTQGRGQNCELLVMEPGTHV